MKIDINKRIQEENIKELAKKQNNKVQEKQEEIPIYNYLKEHPSIFISIISGFVVVIGFLFNCIIYTSECKYLEYWNLNKKLISINNEHKIYELVIMSLLFLGLIAVELFIIDSVDRYYKDKKVFWESNILSIKMYIKYKKDLCQIKKEKRRIKRNNSELLKQELQKEEDIVERSKESLKRYRKSVKDIKNALSAIRRPYDIIVFTTTYFFILGSFYIFITMISIDSKFIHIFIFATAIYSLLWILAYIGLQIGYIPNMYKNFLNKDASEQADLHIQALENLKNIEKYPVQMLLKFNLKNLFTKDMLIKVVFYFFFLLAVFAGIISSSKTYQIEQNKEFDIIEYENAYYAIMYRDDKYFYLEEVKTDGNDIYIYVDNQLRISSDELYSVNREFNNVIKIPGEEGQ